VRSETWRADWMTEKCAIAEALLRGEAGGSYGEAVIVVCAALSALAAEVWPGRGIDRVRFVELLVRHGPQRSVLRTISIPLLVRNLEATGSRVQAAMFGQALNALGPSRVVTGTDVDKTESELATVYPGLAPQALRKHSYASLLYEEVRSSYAHEYRPGARGSACPMTMLRDLPVSYVNRLLDYDTLETTRLIHFHVDWLTKHGIEVAAEIDTLSATLPCELPKEWWIEGAP
jgi:hypothetical protein